MSCALLRLMGHEAIAATSGEDALARAAETAPDIVVLDIGLPDISGYDVARRLRSRPGRRIFIAALTGSNEIEDHSRSLDAGIDMHFVKPTTADKLGEVIRAAEQFEHSPDQA